MLSIAKRLGLFLVVNDTHLIKRAQNTKEGHGEGSASSCSSISFETVYYKNLLYLCFATNIEHGLDNYHLNFY